MTEPATALCAEEEIIRTILAFRASERVGILARERGYAKPSDGEALAMNRVLLLALDEVVLGMRGPLEALALGALELVLGPAAAVEVH